MCLSKVMLYLSYRKGHTSYRSNKVFIFLVKSKVQNVGIQSRSRAAGNWKPSTMPVHFLNEAGNVLFLGMNSMCHIQSQQQKRQIKSKPVKLQQYFEDINTGT